MKPRTIDLQLESELVQLLLDCSRIVDLFQRRDPAFQEQYLQWLKSAETLLSSHKKAESSLLASIRAEALAIGKGVLPAHSRETDPGSGPLSRRKKQTLLISTLPAAQQAVQQVLDPLQQKLDEARELIQQMVAIAFQTGLIQQISFHQGSTSAKLQTLFHTLSSQESTRSGVIRAKMLVSYMDLMILLDQTIARVLGN